MKIGLTYTGSREKQDNYVRWLLENDDVNISELSAEANNLAEIAGCDGIVLTGGIDIHPQYYHNNNLLYEHAPLTFNAARDAFELSVFELAIKMDKPILAICRGMQLVNIGLGGTLHQDLASKNQTHKAAEKDKLHNIIIKEKTVLSNIVNEKKLMSNSAHHQAIDRLGKGLRINCVSEDGVVEGLEWEDQSTKPFLLCVQWHPERMYTANLSDSPLSKSIKSRFINESKQLSS